MKTRSLLLSVLAPVVLTQCVVVDEGGTAGQPSAPSYGQPLTAVPAPGAVIIREGTRTVTSVSTAMANVEETRFINEQEQIVVKSRGNHGPATLQLFNTRTGREEGRVMAYDAQKPNWAAGMGE